MEHKDSQPISNKISDYIDDDMEDIVLKPSTELIPDEYEHVDNTKALVHIFRGEYKYDAKNTEHFYKCLAEMGYNISDDYIHYIRNKEYILKLLKDIAEDTEDKSCLVILFLGNYIDKDKIIFSRENDYILTKDIWSPFTSYQCPNLKDKPKIFIFQVVKYIQKRVMNDARLIVNKNAWYETPGEADMLIAYKKVDADDDRMRLSFISSLCDHIRKNGMRDDIVTLLTLADQSNPNGSRQLLVSTLTKKFYFTSSKFREHHLDIHMSHEQLLETILDLQKKVEEIEKRKKEEKPSVKRVGSIRQTKPKTIPDTTDSLSKVIRSRTTSNSSKTKVPTEKPRWRY